MKLRNVFFPFVLALVLISCPADESPSENDPAVIDPGKETAATPTPTPPAGRYTSAQSVTLATATQGASIRYTTNGSDPTATSALYNSGSPIAVNTTTTIKAIAIKEGMTDSPILTAAYTINIPGAYTVSYTTGEGGGAAPAAQQAAPNGTVAMPGQGGMTAPGGKAFAGWNIDGWHYNTGNTITVTGDITAAAVWMATPTTRTYTNVAYGSDTSNQRVSLWLPTTGIGPFPVIVYVTGGAFQMSSTGTPPGYQTQGLAKGYAVASVQHRVNGTANDGGKFPNQTLDVLAAIRFLRANAAAYNLDTKRFAITGHSAGGYQTHMVAALSNNPEGLARLDPDNVLDTIGNRPGVSTEVLAAVSWAGLSDFAQLKAQHAESGITPSFAHDTASAPGTVMLTRSGETVADLYDPKIADRLTRSNPIIYVTLNMPPLITQSSPNDSTVPYQQAGIMAEKIIEVCGADRVIRDIIPNQNHNTLENVSGNMAKIMDFIDLHLKVQR